MSVSSAYRLVRLANGSHSVHSLAHRETFHPVVGPVAEAESLYVKQLRLPERLEAAGEEFVIWDVGLGAAANVATVLRCLTERRGAIRFVSFDHTREPLEFALQHVEVLNYLSGYEQPARRLLEEGQANWKQGDLEVRWELHLADFPSLLSQPQAEQLPKPHAIMYDAFSPATNSAMWTEPVFSRLYQLIDPARPCALPTYSRSTMLRVTLLLAGFYVGVGHATGEKEETTIAANTLDLVSDPLTRRWLERVERSSSAEPMWEPVYRQAPLQPATRELLNKHPQFAMA